MYLFGTSKFGAHKFGDVWNSQLGYAIQKSIGKEITWRLRRGNGYYDSKLGVLYQDKYKYFVPDSINNPEGQAARDALIAGVINWQGFNAAQKKVYNDRASRQGLWMSGYNLYLREYIRANA